MLPEFLLYLPSLFFISTLQMRFMEARTAEVASCECQNLWQKQRIKDDPYFIYILVDFSFSGVRKFERFDENAFLIYIHFFIIITKINKIDSIESIILWFQSMNFI